MGKSDIENTAKKYGVKNFVQVPIDPAIAASGDKGQTEDYDNQEIAKFFKSIVNN